MRRDPLVCVEDAIEACELILQFTKGMKELEYYSDLKTQAAVERKFEIIGEALNRIKKIDIGMLTNIDSWREIIGFRNIIARGYDFVEDKIVWDSTRRNIPELLKQLNKIIKDS